ncbi:MAG: LruC domain-containing protein [Bacteroidia bacterium]|nr:LruC domain-containing protein [Bacteroidia bacterium]MCF8428227.1 LruC domain-containing protein [Bacteroidia bacterium]
MKNIFFIILTLFAFSNCKKLQKTEVVEQTADLSKNVNNINEMIVPDGFNYDNNRKIEVTVSVSEGKFGSQLQRIQLFDGNPISNGSLLVSGSANYLKPFTCNLTLPKSVETIYIVKTNPDNSSITEIVSAKTNKIQISDMGKRGLELRKSMPSSPDCNTGCTSTVTGNSNISLNNAANTVCVTGNFSGDISINNGTVRICGNATIGNCNLNNSSTLLIASGATVTFSSINVNGASCTFSNWSPSVTINGSFSPGGIVNNYGTLTISETFNVNGQANVTNEGTINISGSLNNNKTITNNGTISVSESFAQNGGGVFTNNCKFIVSKNAALNNPLSNNGFISVIQSTTINGGGVLTMSSGSMYLTENLTLNSTITGSGSTSLVKVNDNTTINGGGNINGAIQFCDANGIETNFGTIASGVSIACNQYIPTSSCNPVGNGIIVVPDTDGDGANDNIDEYPSDPDLAFNNFYPNEKGTATVAFEDLWPSKGDYDLNDLVMDFRHNIITNSNNEVIKFEGYYRLRASGGAQNIAFCMGIPLAPDIVEKLTGATLEEGHSNLVFQLFENNKNELKGWNTVMSQAKVDYAEYNVSFSVNKGPSLKEFGSVSAFDPFIWMNSKEKGRGYEIHVPGNAPTKYADTKLFGYANDATDIGKEKYYLTANNLPWAIVIPSTYDYCVELSLLGLKENPDITQAHLHFAQWAQSGGEIYSDWYENFKGYRTEEYIYSK